jgi:RNA polymerase subunit RPABC4/transcription elongation factor Spt4
MEPNRKCNNCEKYAKQGHNYCRICGFHLTKGYVQYIRIAVIYNSNEKYCGYCGKLRTNCKC